MTYVRLARMITAEVFAVICAKGCATCGGGGWIGGSSGHPCPACNGGGKSASESMRGSR